MKKNIVKWDDITHISVEKEEKGFKAWRISSKKKNQQNTYYTNPCSWVSPYAIEDNVVINTWPTDEEKRETKNVGTGRKTCRTRWKKGTKKEANHSLTPVAGSLPLPLKRTLRGTMKSPRWCEAQKKVSMSTWFQSLSTTTCSGRSVS